MFAPKQGHAVAIKDVRTLNHYIHQTYADLPVVLFGHSMGGLIALNYVFDHADTVDAVAIWNSNFDGGAQSAAALALLYMERMLKGSDVPSGILPRLTFRAWGRSIKGIAHCSTGSRMTLPRSTPISPIRFAGFDASVALWIDIFHMIRRGANNRNFASIPKHLPFHLIGGAEDPATAGGAAIQRLAERMRRMGFDRVTHNILPATRHESLNEINRDAVTQKFLNWLMEALPSRATGR